jgi:1-phosphatidylinositol phosphodiesterase
MAPNITLRNISNQPLTLKLVEYFDPEQKSINNAFNLKNVTSALSNVTNAVGLTNHSTRAEVPEISRDAQPFDRREVDIRLEPFQIVKTDIEPTKHGEKDRTRLTFEAGNGERHRMYTPVPTTSDTPELEVDGNPENRFTGIYLPEDSFVAIYSSKGLNNWMGRLPDSTPLGALSIPGTHNSPTHHNAPPSVRCQAVSPWDQLQNGVRFFDLRVQVPEPFNLDSDKLVLVHSVFPISLTGNKYFRDLYEEVLKFLRENPSETLIMSLKREGSGKGTDEQLSQILKKHYKDGNPEQWFTRPWVPNLSDCRGKIVLVRRFNLEEGLKHEHDNKGWGIDASQWADNTANSTCPSGDVCVQDFYQVDEPASINQKIIFAQEHLERSGCCRFPPNGEHREGEKFPLYINFLSASNFWKVGTWPEKVAAAINPEIVKHLCHAHMLKDDGGVKEGDWSTGIVVMDWVGQGGDWDLCRCVVGMNAKLLSN